MTPVSTDGIGKIVIDCKLCAALPAFRFPE
jgi:hypothetical protein